MSLVQISDVHIGSRRAGFLRRIAKRIRAQNPTAVLITGDLIDAPNVSRQDLAPLGDLGAPTYFCIGNHERYEDLDDILDRLAALGIRVLRNESVDAPPFQFIGIDDADAHDTVRTAWPASTRWMPARACCCTTAPTAHATPPAGAWM